MIELNQKVWDGLVYEFAKSLSKGRTIEQALMCFIEDYWTELDTLSRKAGLKEDDEEVEESLDVYFERKMKPMWDYVYTLKAEISNLKAEVALLKEANAARTIPYGPIKYPNNIPPTHEYPLDWYKVTAHSNAQDNQRIPGLMPEGFATSGYMQVTDKKYTPKYTTEQLEEWSNIRYTSEGR